MTKSDYDNTKSDFRVRCKNQKKKSDKKTYILQMDINKSVYKLRSAYHQDKHIIVYQNQICFFFVKIRFCQNRNRVIFNNLETNNPSQFDK